MYQHIEAQTNGRHFSGVISKCIFLNENARMSIIISLEFVPKIPIDNAPALVQIIAWRLTGGKPLYETTQYIYRHEKPLQIPQISSIPLELKIKQPASGINQMYIYQRRIFIWKTCFGQLNQFWLT